MKPEVRKVYLTIAFTPMDREIDRRAQYHLRHFDAMKDERSQGKRSLLPLALMALVLWSAIAAAVWFLVHTWSA